MFPIQNSSKGSDLNHTFTFHFLLSSSLCMNKTAPQQVKFIGLSDGSKLTQFLWPPSM